MKYCGFDVARMGSDYSVLTNITFEETVRVDRIDFFSKLELMELCGWSIQIFKKMFPDKITVDMIGVGAGVYDRLNEQGFPVVGVNVAEAPCKKPEDYKNKKAEMYWNLRNLFEREEIEIPNIPHRNKLVAELSKMKYTYDSKGKLLIVDPEDKSPDFADSLALACYGPIISARVPGVVMF